MKKLISLAAIIFVVSLLFVACNSADTSKATTTETTATPKAAETPEYFLLRPEAEKAYGYSHAVKIGNDIKISGAVSMDDAGAPTAKGDLLQQMKKLLFRFG